MAGSIMEWMGAAGLAASLGTVALVCSQYLELERTLDRQTEHLGALSERLDGLQARRDTSRPQRDARIETVVGRALERHAAHAPGPRTAARPDPTAKPDDDGPEDEQLDRLAEEGMALAHQAVDRGVLTREEGDQLRALLRKLDRDRFLQVAGIIGSAINRDALRVDDLSAIPF